MTIELFSIKFGRTLFSNRSSERFAVISLCFLDQKIEVVLGIQQSLPPLPKFISHVFLPGGHLTPPRSSIVMHHHSLPMHNPYHHKHWSRFHQGRQKNVTLLFSNTWLFIYMYYSLFCYLSFYI